MKETRNQKHEFQEIINRFSQFIQAHIQKFDPQKKGIDPEDIAQEIRIKLWNIINSEKKIINYSSYIKKVVDSTVIDYLRKSRKQEGIINNEKKKKIAEYKNFYKMNSKDDYNNKELINETLNSLRDSRRTAVRLFLLNMSIEEIAVFLNWSRNKTRNLIYRGLTDLKRKLKEKGIKYED